MHIYIGQQFHEVSTSQTFPVLDNNTMAGLLSFNLEFVITCRCHLFLANTVDWCTNNNASENRMKVLFFSKKGYDFTQPAVISFNHTHPLYQSSRIWSDYIRPRGMVWSSYFTYNMHFELNSNLTTAAQMEWGILMFTTAHARNLKTKKVVVLE